MFVRSEAFVLITARLRGLKIRTKSAIDPSIPFFKQLYRGSQRLKRRCQTPLRATDCDSVRACLWQQPSDTFMFKAAWHEVRLALNALDAHSPEERCKRLPWSVSSADQIPLQNLGKYDTGLARPGDVRKPCLNGSDPVASTRRQK